MNLESELNPFNAICFNAPLTFDGYQFAASNRLDHFSDVLSDQLFQIITSEFPQIWANFSKFHSLDLVSFKEVIYWLNRAIQLNDYPIYIYDILYSHLEDVINSITFIELTPDQSLIMDNAGFIPMPLGQQYRSILKFYESVSAVALIDDYSVVLQRIREVGRLIGALEIFHSKMIDVDYNPTDNLRISSEYTKCPFCLKSLKKNDCKSVLVKPHVLGVREFHDSIVNQLVKSISNTAECPGVGKPSIENDVEYIKVAVMKYCSVMLLLERIFNESNQTKRLRSARSAYKYIKAKHDELMKYFNYYKVSE